MPIHLPYRTKTASGQQADISFQLHPLTVSPTRVSHMLTAILEAIDREVKLDPSTSNGDVLQATAMALAIRSHMVDAGRDSTTRLIRELIETSLHAMKSARQSYMRSGHA